MKKKKKLMCSAPARHGERERLHQCTVPRVRTSSDRCTSRNQNPQQGSVSVKGSGIILVNLHVRTVMCFGGSTLILLGHADTHKSQEWRKNVESELFTQSAESNDDKFYFKAPFWHPRTPRNKKHKRKIKTG